MVLALEGAVGSWPHVGATCDEAAHGTGVAASFSKLHVPLQGHGMDGHTPPDHEVERDQHHAGSCG